MGFSAPADFRKRPVAVLGGGVLGRRIAACWIAGGWNVNIRDPSEAQRKQAEDYVAEHLGEFTVLTKREPGKLSTSDDLPAMVKDAWLVIEAVPEKLPLKISTFADLEKHAPEDCILGSNSSSYKSSEMLEQVSDATKARILNTHYMMPPAALIVELMTDGHTDPDLFPFMVDRLRDSGCHPIVALKESTGFVFNRVWAAIKREVLKVLQEGVSTPDQIDAVFKEMYNANIGPCRSMDEIGLDTVSFIENHYVTERKLDQVHLDWLDKNYIDQGHLGKKTPGKGGLYPKPAAGAETQLVFLNIGTAEPLDDKLTWQDCLHRGSILSFNATESPRRPTEILTHEYMPDGIDVADGRMYWTDMGNPRANDGSILSANLDGSDVETLVSNGQIHTPKQLITDVEGKKLYFSDREGGRVFRCDFTGQNLECLYQSADYRNGPLKPSQWCVGIAISKKLNKVFWTLKGASKSNEGQILSAGLETPKDPANRTDIEVVADKLPEPIDLEMDDEIGALYWTDRGELPLGNSLNRKTLIGKPPKEEEHWGRLVLAQQLNEAIGLKLDKKNDCIWVADIGGHIWKCNPHRPAFKEKVYESQTGAFTGLTFVRV